MLSQIGGRSNQLPLISNSDQKSPYILQYKIFQDRLKRQQRTSKVASTGEKKKKTKTKLQQDYIELTRNILSKKQNYNLFEDVPICQTEPSLCVAYSQQLSAKTRSLFERASNHNYRKSHFPSNQSNCSNSNTNLSLQKVNLSASTHQEQALTEVCMRENSAYAKSRICSQALTNILRKEKSKSQAITFLGYKKNKRPVIQMAFKKVFG